jgi:hypothetical protein
MLLHPSVDDQLYGVPDPTRLKNCLANNEAPILSPIARVFEGGVVP